jgi:hypothetical protein
MTVEVLIVGMFSDLLNGFSDAVPHGGVVYRVAEYDTPFLNIMSRQFVERQGIYVLDIEGIRRVIGKLVENIAKVFDDAQLVPVANFI